MMPTKENTERAHVWCDKNSVDFIVEDWLALEFDKVQAEARLSEAKWWHWLLDTGIVAKTRNPENDCCKRIASLEAQAAHPSEGVSDWPECEEFYNLMQAYRHEPVGHVVTVKQNYEAVKSWLREALRPQTFINRPK